MKVDVLSPPKPTTGPRRRSSMERINSFREAAGRYTRRWAAQRVLLVLWVVQGLVPLGLQTRSFVKFATPHKISDKLVVSPDQPKLTANISDECPAKAFMLAGVWWNQDPIYYYKVDNNTICHVVVPQYNIHGNYVIGKSKATPYSTTPSSCASDSFSRSCTKDKTAYTVAEVLGTYDTNGEFLANDSGSAKTRSSYWYSTVGMIWLMYRVLMIRRSYLSCRHYGRQCDAFGEKLTHPEAMVFVQESLRLTAHGATNYQRSAMLYLIAEGVMTDLFLIITNDCVASKVQYVSLGYNLSGLMLLLFEMVERMNWLSEQWRLGVKRLLFSYETALVGELVTALALQAFLSSLNASDLKRSKPTALAVSYYFWSLVCHGAVVLVIVSIMSAARILCALVYVWLKHRSFAVFSAPCCVDSVLGLRSRLMLLGGYRFHEGELYYARTSLKAFGLLQMEEDGGEYLVLHKLNWFSAPPNNLVAIGVIRDSRVEICNERLCTRVVRFLDRRLGGTASHPV